MLSPSRARTLSLALLLAMLSLASAQEVTEVKDGDASKKAAGKKTVDLCICLDTSGSMRGLIDSARSRIWSVVNDLALAKPTPRLRVALIAYGGGSYDSTKGWVQVQTGFTEDLDLVSSKLFALKATGSTEYVGRALQTAMAFDWQKGTDALKLIVVAGNESADQDPAVPFRDMCKTAITGGVMVNSIYCGAAGHADAAGWKEIALLSDGHYAVIEQHGTVTLQSPFDKKIAALSTAVNSTYVAFGKKGKEGVARQEAADNDAGAMGEDTAALRGSSKASKLYYNRWCLIDSLDRRQVKLEEVKDKDLPKEMRGMTLEQKKAHLDKKRAERKKIQAEIKVISAKRAGWIATEMKKRAIKDNRSFDAAVRKAIRAQAKQKGYKFEQE